MSDKRPDVGGPLSPPYIKDQVHRVGMERCYPHVWAERDFDVLQLTTAICVNCGKTRVEQYVEVELVGI